MAETTTAPTNVKVKAMAAKGKDKVAAVEMTPKPDRDWQTEEDVRTLQRAAEIRNDGDRHGKAQSRAKEMMGDLANVAEVGVVKNLRASGRISEKAAAKLAAKKGDAR